MASTMIDHPHTEIEKTSNQTLAWVVAIAVVLVLALGYWVNAYRMNTNPNSNMSGATTSDTVIKGTR